MRLAALFDAAGVEVIRGGEAEITSICTDSREVRPGSLFFARRGWFVDANGFVAGAAKAGAAAVVVTSVDAERDAPSLPVALSTAEDRDLARMADVFFEHPSRRLRVFAVTGTNGKTSVTYLLEHVLRAMGERPAVIGTVSHRFESEVIAARNTTPDGLMVHGLARRFADAGATCLVIEASSHGLELGRIAGLAVDVVGFTNLTVDHLDFHKNMDAYGAAKMRLFSEIVAASMGAGKRPVGVAWTDDPFGATMLRQLPGGARGCAVGRANAEATIRATSPPGPAGGTFEFRVNDQTFRGISTLAGDFNLANVGVALAMAGAAFPERVGQAVTSLASFAGIPGRFEAAFAPRAGLPAVFVDYAHTPDAIVRALDTARAFTPDELVIVTGCGGDRDRAKRGPMARAAAERADRVYFTADNPRSERIDDILDEMTRDLPEALRAKCVVVPDRAQAIRLAVGTSRGTVVIAGKGHETYQEVAGVRHAFDDREEARRAAATCRRDGHDAPLVAGWSADRVAAAVDGRVAAAAPRQPYGDVVIDSRRVRPGDIFVALEGERHDAHAFVDDVVAAGAACVIVRRGHAVRGALDVIEVDDTLRALQRLAAAVLNEGRARAGSLRVLGITGSNGKTTTKELAARLLGDGTLVTIGNLNNHVGLPLTALRLTHHHRFAVLEMGASKPGDINELAAIARPDVAVITSIGEAHLEGMGGLDGVRQTKLEVARHGASVLLVPADERAQLPAPDAGTELRCFAAGDAAHVPPGADIVASTVGPRRLRLSGPGRASIEVAQPLPGPHNASNLAAAVLAAEALASSPLDASTIDARLAGLSLPAGRLAERMIGGRAVIDDAYNANPASMRASLALLAERMPPRVAVLGEMRELGADADALHEAVGRVAQRAADTVVAVGQAARPIARGAGSRALHFDEVDAAAAWLGEHVPVGATVLLKASRGAALERIVPLLASSWEAN